MAFNFFLLFVISYFLSLAYRLPFLGSIRFDLLLMGATAVAIVGEKNRENRIRIKDIDKTLFFLFAYIILSLPFVQWPGSVINTGLENFVKAVVFYFFAIFTLNTEKRVKTFMVVFLACQSFRILEPLYLHVRYGYWGDAAFVAYGESMNRLAGSPSDVLNPNGLAFVIVSVIPFYHYLCLSSSIKMKALYFVLLPVVLYALMLTGSRSGFLALLVVLMSIVVKSKRKALLIGLIVLGIVFAFSKMDGLQQERLLSIYMDDVRGSGTAQGRIEGLKKNFEVVLNKPIFGHGLGTSLEANYNIKEDPLRSHNLYLEVWQELGVIGLFIFLVFMKSTVSNYLKSFRQLKTAQSSPFLYGMANGLGVGLVMYISFSFASYGLSSYAWYLFSGLIGAVSRLSEALDFSKTANAHG